MSSNVGTFKEFVISSIVTFIKTLNNIRNDSKSISYETRSIKYKKENDYERIQLKVLVPGSIVELKGGKIQSIQLPERYDGFRIDFNDKEVEKIESKENHQESKKKKHKKN